MKRFDPIAATEEIGEAYRDYVASLMHFDNPGLQKQLEDALSERESLFKGPLLEAAPPYRPSMNLLELVSKDVFGPWMLELGGLDERRPF